MAKRKNPLFPLAALGVVAFGAMALSSRPAAAKPAAGSAVKGKSGKTWRVVLLSTSGATKTYEVFSPAGSFGPHGELSVVRYAQTGADTTARKIVGRGRDVPDAMFTTAAADFGLKA